MKNKKINVIVLRNNQGKEILTSFETIEDKLETFYKIIGCDCIDIQVRYINGKPYNIIMDDEFLLKSVPVITMIEKNHQEYLCGNLIICPINQDNEEELGSFKSYAEQYKVFQDLNNSKLTYTFDNNL